MSQETSFDLECKDIKKKLDVYERALMKIFSEAASEVSKDHFAFLGESVKFYRNLYQQTLVTSWFAPVPLAPKPEGCQPVSSKEMVAKKAVESRSQPELPYEQDEEYEEEDDDKEVQYDD